VKREERGWKEIQVGIDQVTVWINNSINRLEENHLSFKHLYLS